VFSSFMLTLTAGFIIWFPIALDFRMARRHVACPPKFTMATILHDPAGFESMASFLKLEFSAENVYFYQRVEEYRLPQNRGAGAAEYLFDTFIASNSPYQVNLAATTVDAIAEKLQRADPKQSVNSIFMKPAQQKARTSTLDMTSVVGLRSTSTDASVILSVEDLTSLFDAAQTEVLRLMEKDSWVRYLQSSQFAAFARDHVRSAHQFADTVEKKMLAQPLSSASTVSNPSSRSSETKPSTGEKEKIVLDVKGSRGEPENTDRSSDGSTGETLRSSRCSSEKLRSSTRTLTFLTPDPSSHAPAGNLNAPMGEPKSDQATEPEPDVEIAIKAFTTTTSVRDDVEITIKSFTSPTTQNRDSSGYVECA